MAAAGIEQRFGATAEMLRKKREPSYAELADRSSLYRTYVPDVQRERHNISLQCIERLAHALEAPIAAPFLHSDDNPDRPASS